ncbi:MULTISPECIES: tautomerase family protein [Ramlibacter]|jgi:phenylpyruvate tautomerase PptA (4-oxalocrotonate tautomerase family)|uniref:Tautomerase family protein n=1 Tax=Ramlibacter pinisoli TaxID=2682844 RepID=A0A6N8IWH7_9BURK|nr:MULTISPECIES: tautomerase family protein [Ramlibacter]MBA2965484.1 tautomerase family protein [Ramlibacter sp. CGMCC 1.13660]MVQ30450.1 tautomerase family protein [Ramlibacter pinisoli]
MPLVRIDLPASVPAPAAAAVSRAVHQALVDIFQVPPDDLFHVVARRAPGELVCTPRFLGIEHGDRVAFVQIACSPGRTVGLKEALYDRIARDVARAADLRGEDVIVNLLETARENWSFGAGLAQYALQDRARPAVAS